MKAQYVDFTHESIEDLVYKYGTNTDEILDAARLIDGEDNLLKAELNYGIENESVISISDFLIRRTGRLFFERPTLANKYHQIHQYICDKCGHSKEVSDKQLALFEKEYFGVIAFKS
ncbi:MAG: glycerol-3-phosphate dehydrogenase C-terminal domain-containing protein [Chitinophagales bacterium]